MTIAHCVQQLVELLAALKLDGASHDVVGWSIGGVIASKYAHLHPERVTRLVLLAPVGAVPAVKPWTAHLLHVPLGVGNALGALVMGSSLRKLYTRELGCSSKGAVKEMLHFLCEHATNNRNLVRTIISTIRSCPEVDDNRETYIAIGESQRPVLILWGDADHTVPDRPDELLSMLPRAKLHELRGQAHSFMVTAPDECNGAIVSFLAPDPTCELPRVPRGK